MDEDPYDPSLGEALLDDYLEIWDDDTLPDGAYLAVLEEGVQSFNSSYGTSYDPRASALDYLSRKGEVDNGNEDDRTPR